MWFGLSSIFHYHHLYYSKSDHYSKILLPHIHSLSLIFPFCTQSLNSLMKHLIYRLFQWLFEVKVSNIKWPTNIRFFSALWKIQAGRTTLCSVVTANIYFTIKHNWSSHSVNLLIDIHMMAQCPPFPCKSDYRAAPAVILHTKLLFHFNNNPIYTRTSGLNIEST